MKEKKEKKIIRLEEYDLKKEIVKLQDEIEQLKSARTDTPK